MRRIANPPKRTPKRAETNRNGSQNGQKQPETTGTGSIRYPKLGIPSPAVPDNTLRQVLEYLPQSTLTHSARHVPALRSSHLRCPPLLLRSIRSFRSRFIGHVSSRCSIGYVPSDLQSDGAKYEDLQSEKLIPILYAINAKTRSSGKQRGTYSFRDHRPLYLYTADSEIRQNEETKTRNEPRELFFVKSPAAHCQDARTHPSKLLRLSWRNRPAFSVGSFFLLATVPYTCSISFHPVPPDLKSIVPNIKICSLPEQKPSNCH